MSTEASTLEVRTFGGSIDYTTTLVNGFLVPAKCSEFIGKIEPQQYLFIPVSIEGLDGSPVEFFYLNCVNWAATDDLYRFSNRGTKVRT
jgi:hypothetical protein